MWRRVVCYKITSISNEAAAFFFRVEKYKHFPPKLSFYSVGWGESPIGTPASTGPIAPASGDRRA
jgi:hypothetical protein